MSDRKTPEYISWSGMRYRCNSPRCKSWKNYGGRGIKVCARWESFDNFLADMGRRPAGATLDRIDNEGNYEPGNCQWATREEQARKRRNVKLTIAVADDIRRKYAGGAHPEKLAQEYGVVRGVIDHIIADRTWRSGFTVRRRTFRNPGSSHLTADAVKDIRSRKESASKVAAEYGVHRASIERIRRRETWSWVE